MLCAHSQDGHISCAISSHKPSGVDWPGRTPMAAEACSIFSLKLLLLRALTLSPAMDSESMLDLAPIAMDLHKR